MRGERFYAKRFSRVMSAEDKVDSKLLRGDRSPVRCFAGDESVDLPAVAVFAEAGLVRCDTINFRTCAASDDPDVLRILRTEVECLYRTTKHFSQFANQVVPRPGKSRANTDELSFFLKEWFRRFQSQRRR